MRDFRSHPLLRGSVLLGILLLATVLRAYHLENQSLWEDEIYSWWASHFDTLDDMMHYGVLPDLHPPGYQLLMFGVQRLVGDSEFALRLPSALAGVLAVALTYALGRRLYGHDEGVIAAGLAAVLWFPIHYSQEARSYALLLVGVLGTTLLWLRCCTALQQGLVPGPRPLRCAYVALAALTAYLHYFGLYLIVWQAVGSVLWLGFRRFRTLLPFYGVWALLYAPWMGALRRQLLLSNRSSWISPVGSLPNVIFDFSKHVLNQRPAQAYAAWGLVVLALALDLARRRTRPVPARATAFLLLWLVLPLTGVYAFSRWVKPILTYRNLIIAVPALYLLIARGLTRLPGRWLLHVVAGGALALFTYQIVWGGYYVLPRKTQFREAAVWMQAHPQALADGTVIGQFAYPFLLDYGFRRHPQRHPVALLVEKDRICTGAAPYRSPPHTSIPVCPTVCGDFQTVLGRRDVMTRETVIRAAVHFAQAQPTRFLWYVTALGEPLVDAKQWRDAGFEERERQYFFGIHVYLYRRSAETGERPEKVWGPGTSSIPREAYQR